MQHLHKVLQFVWPDFFLLTTYLHPDKTPDLEVCAESTELHTDHTVKRYIPPASNQPLNMAMTNTHTHVHNFTWSMLSSTGSLLKAHSPLQTGNQKTVNTAFTHKPDSVINSPSNLPVNTALVSLGKWQWIHTALNTKLVTSLSPVTGNFTEG